MNKEPELKRCPFCGNEFNHGHKSDCYFRVRGKDDESREKAWQNRPLEDKLQAEIERLKEEISALKWPGEPSNTKDERYKQ